MLDQYVFTEEGLGDHSNVFIDAYQQVWDCQHLLMTAKLRSTFRDHRLDLSRQRH